MRKFLKTNWIVITIFLTLIGGMLASHIYFQSTYTKSDVRTLEDELAKIKSHINNQHNQIIAMHKKSNIFFESIDQDYPIHYALYNNDSLVWWNDKASPLSGLTPNLLTGDTVVYLNHAWRYMVVNQRNQYTVVGMATIKYEYPYENAFLQNTYAKPFNFPETATITLKPLNNFFPVYAKSNGQVLMYIGIKDLPKNNPWVKGVSIFLFVCFLLLVLVYIFRLANRFAEKHKPYVFTIFLVLFLILGYAFAAYFQFPKIIFESALFNPYLFADARWLPSLGGFLLLSILMFYLQFFLYVFYPLNHNRKEKAGFYIYLLVLAFMLFAFYYTMYSLVNNSNLSFEAYKVQGLNVYSFIGWFIILLQGSGTVLLIFKLSKLLSGDMPTSQYFISSVLVIAFTLLLIKIQLLVSFGNIVLMVLLIITLWYAANKGIEIHQLTIGSLVLFLLTLVIVEDLNRNKLIQERNTKKLIANNLAYEHDHVAEVLLERMTGSFIADSSLADMVLDYDYPIEEIHGYLKKNYFNGYWNGYDLQITTCSPNDSLFIDYPVNCYQYFNNYIQQSGIRIADGNFYFLDVINGRINYLGRFYYKNKQNTQMLIIELRSKLTTVQLGYPELLMRGNEPQNKTPQNFSYAKYFQGELISQSGEFPYSLHLADDSLKFQYKYTIQEGYRHLLYKVDANNVIMVSKRIPNVFDLLITFSYVFIFNFITVLLVVLILRNKRLKGTLRFSLQNKVQLTIVSILLISLLLIGSGTVYFAIREYREKHFDMLQEKINSVYIELDHKLAMEENLNSFWYSDKYGTLDQLLQKFSDVFFTDINLYYPDGTLMASSRKEVFETGLTGWQMEPKAYKAMSIQNQAIHIQREEIGKLNYLSAYVPFTNIDNELLAYLNLPYFTKENSLRNEIINLIVALINIYVLLILITMVVAVFISRQITLPLAAIQRKMQVVDLKNKNEPIHYVSKDEIGQLVKEYNRMIAELEKSADLLAKSERESAWREMARQIAHEIKNPLTPMKLSVQHLQRTWTSQKAASEEYIQQFTNSLIEQIDNLSAIATAFSNFAKMPEARKQQVDLVKKLKNLTHFFQNENNIEIKFTSNLKEAWIKADKEQIISAFNNVIKNGIQAIPKTVHGHIEITLDKKGSYYCTTIADNGKGVPEEMYEKLFLPNFTTKSSGTGLGLAITKSIIESIGGQITFISQVGKGTKFEIKLPPSD